MNRLQIVKRALLSYVNTVKFIWSELAYPLIIIGKKFMNLRDYKIYGNSVEKPVNLVDLSTCTYGVYINDTGVEASTTNFGLTDYINIDTNETYNVSVVDSGDNNTLRINYYDADKNWLSQYKKTDIGANNTFASTIDMVDNTAYIRISYILPNLKVYHPKSVDHPVKIQSVGDLTTKNLIPLKTSMEFTAISNDENYMHYKVDKGKLVARGSCMTSGISSNNEAFKNNFSFSLKAGTYTLSFYKEENSPFGELFLKYLDTNEVVCSMNIGQHKTFTLDSDCDVYLGIYTINFENSEGVVLDIQLEKVRICLM